VRTFCGQGRRGKFFAILYGRLLWTAPHCIKKLKILVECYCLANYSNNTACLFTSPKKKWLFWRAEFFPANQFFESLVAFLEGRLFSSQSELFESSLNYYDWLDKDCPLLNGFDHKERNLTFKKRISKF